jgi:hypothetical protein
VWATALVVVAFRLLHLSHAGATYRCYIGAGESWRAGRPIYGYTGGSPFVYGPLIAAYFAAYTFVPLWFGKIVWLLTNVALLIGGMFAVLRAGVFPIASDKGRALVFILLLPLSLANLDISQANPALAGLLLIAIAAAARERWFLCAIAIGIATYLKIYPLALGLLLCVHAPGKITLRLACALILLGLFSLVLQNPRYVLSQYHVWFASRAGDDRRLNSLARAPLDLWYLLARLGHLPLSERAYQALQILSGAGIAVFCRLTPRSQPARRLAGIYLLGSCWMILLGPATESYTYAILAPAFSLGVAVAFCATVPPVAAGLAIISTALMLLAQTKSSFFTQWHGGAFEAVRPAAALLFLGFAIPWLGDSAAWAASGSSRESTPPAERPACAEPRA